jgi:hypothetical protein
MKHNSLFCIQKRTVYVLFFFVVLLSALLFIAGNALQTTRTNTRASSPTIVGGVNATQGEYPSVAWVNGCTGTLIGPSWVLTAAHCLEKLTVNYISIRLGSIYFGKQCEWVWSDKFYIHPKRVVDSQLNDIALVHLSRPITSITSYPLLPEPVIDEDLYAKDTPIDVLGWGCIAYKEQGIPSLSQGWRICPQYTDEAECFSKGRAQGCKYLFTCKMCVPAKQPSISYAETPENCDTLATTIEWYTRFPPITVTPYLPADNITTTNILQKLSTTISIGKSSDYANRFVISGKSFVKSGCFGDSGGPAYAHKNGKEYVIGAARTPLESTRVIEYTPWIRETMQTNDPAQSTPVKKTVVPFAETDLKFCVQFSDEESCFEKGKKYNCGYHPSCNLCLPWQRSGVDYDTTCENCEYYRKQINPLWSTPTPRNPGNHADIE